ncbi:MAG TPA: hypothetical protein PK878_02230 [bacterium]|nr:hypothetical protein [Candidatus Omnitrophota bacterium]HOJ59080.1 hypothetical protein [bacterium]HOL93280.1 hypothetical protein [bacterium]HPP01327.1 hypothetical protein [bacterium]HXK94644.1 hypothetical protein [bacterium]
MWIFTSNAFVSIVKDRNNPERRLVRARCAGDIEALFPDADVFQDPGADYRFRAFLPASEVSQRLSEYVQAMEYTNFKHSIPREKEKYHEACTWVWSLMRGLQEPGT